MKDLSGLFEECVAVRMSLFFHRETGVLGPIIYYIKNFFKVQIKERQP